MKKIIIAIMLVFTFIVLPINTLEVYAQEEYDSYVEVIMSTGKLLKYYTKEELKEQIKEIDKMSLYSVRVKSIDRNVPATYISNTLFSVDNQSETAIEYNVSITVETYNKTTFSADGSLSTSASGTIKKVKAEAAIKGNVSYSETNSKSKKETKTMKLPVEGGSRAIIYLTGELSVSNGVFVVYTWFFKSASGGYEFVTLKSQYARVEKRKL